MVEDIDLLSKGATNVTLGGEVASIVPIYLAEILWANQPRTIPILEMAGVPLVGMSLLHGRHLHIMSSRAERCRLADSLDGEIVRASFDDSH